MKFPNEAFETEQDLIDWVCKTKHDDAAAEVAKKHGMTKGQVKWRLRDNTGKFEEDAWYDDYFATLDRYVQEALHS